MNVEKVKQLNRDFQAINSLNRKVKQITEKIMSGNYELDKEDVVMVKEQLKPINKIYTDYSEVINLFEQLENNFKPIKELKTMFMMISLSLIDNNDQAVIDLKAAL